ncbi:uncharacterized protein LOC131626966 [Vicia villosa]|uniref:uncharacterized protein LOC131626966 n=1 Tax=Vicia villosa TaxID=3911 RepID=UPI00273BAA60|nr:uncharacterized protein LOC131626966 [Vicia villosa]
MHVVSQVTDRAVVPIDVPVTPVPAEPSPSILVEGSSPSVLVEGPSPSTTSSRRPRDDAEGFSQMPSTRRRRRGSSFTFVFVLVTVDTRSSMPEPVWYPGGPIEASLLTEYANHSARHIWEREDREPQKFYNHGRKIAALTQPGEAWFQDVLTTSGPRDLCQYCIEEEVEGTGRAHVKFHFLRQQYDVELLAAHAVAGDDDEVDIHKLRALRCYFLYLSGTQLFVDTSSSYIDVVYPTYLSDTACVREYNWGAATLAYTYHRLGEECLWKERIGWILQHFPGIIGWGEVSGYTEAMPRDRAFVPFRGNQGPNPYKRCLDRMFVGDVRYDYYDVHRETVPWDDFAIYSGWLAASSTIIVRYLLERVMRQVGYQQTIPRPSSDFVPIAVTRRQLDDSLQNGSITWFRTRLRRPDQR